MITTVLLEGSAHRPLAIEESLIRSLAVERGLEVVVATEKQLSRNRITVSPQTLAVGSVPFVKHALRQLGRELPRHLPYPSALAHLLFRDVRRLPSLMDARALLERGEHWFVKPATWKRFTGFVPEHAYDHRFNGASKATPVYISTPVRFLSEWRVYVANGNLLQMCFANHDGDRAIVPDYDVIVDAVSMMTDAGAPAGYVIDFGVLDTGETALVEMNDGFSFGAYDGVQAATVWDVSVNRWNELIQEKR